MEEMQPESSREPQACSSTEGGSLQTSCHGQQVATATGEGLTLRRWEIPGQWICTPVSGLGEVETSTQQAGWLRAAEVLR